MSRRAGALCLAGAFITAGIATAATVQQGNLRITVLAQLKPYKLPRETPAPIAVFVAGHLQNPNGGIPPQLQRMKIEVNRHGLLQSKGLPTCQVAQIQPGSSERALENCQDALIGSGRFWANIVLPDQGAYPTQGRLLIFNGRQGGRPAILTHIFTDHPFNSSFVIPFSIRRVSKGPYGTELEGIAPTGPGRLGLPGPDQAHPEAQIHPQGPPTLLLQLRLPRAGRLEAGLLPIGLRRILLRRAQADGGDCGQDVRGQGMRNGRKR